MTREEAIKELTELLPEEFLSEYADAIKMGIEALKNQPTDAVDRMTIKEYLYNLGMGIKVTTADDVLDKIKAEIEAKCCITVGRENDSAITLHDVFEIIDKYKAESEDKK